MKARASGRQEENEKRCQSARADNCSESSAWSPMKRSRHGPLLGGAVGDRLVVAIVVVAGPDSLPAPRCRLPTPARAAVEADACDERRRGKGEEAAIMESMETSERKPVDARCKSWPEREAAGADESTAESCAAEPAAYRRAAEPAAYRCAVESSAYRRTAETAPY